MKESIYTIPISEVFEPKQGCPLCALHRGLENRWVQYITGAAMMEADVRYTTDAEGFCGQHLAKMLALQNRLPVALLLQTRLQYLMRASGEGPKAAAGWGKRKQKAENGCFVCKRVDGELTRLAGNLVAVWAREESFRSLYSEQEYLCVPHHALLLSASEKLRGKERSAFRSDTGMLLQRGLVAAGADIDAFCKLFDYRSNNGDRPSEKVAGSIEQAARLLCGIEFEG